MCIDQLLPDHQATVAHRHPPSPTVATVTATTVTATTVTAAGHHTNPSITTLTHPDEAASKCSAPYRAPELTEVKYPCSIDERVDVWSLGCTA